MHDEQANFGWIITVRQLYTFLEFNFPRKKKTIQKTQSFASSTPVCFEDDNRIITDVGQLYIQERDYERFTTQRGKLLPTKPSARAHWVATSVGHYLCNRLERSYKLIDTWFKTSKTKSVTFSMQVAMKFLFFHSF
jgi:hypothetical protein